MGGNEGRKKDDDGDRALVGARTLVCDDQGVKAMVGRVKKDRSRR